MRVAGGLGRLAPGPLRLIRGGAKRTDSGLDAFEGRADGPTARPGSAGGIPLGSGGAVRSIDERAPHIDEQHGIKP